MIITILPFNCERKDCALISVLPNKTTFFFDLLAGNQGKDFKTNAK